MWKRSGGWVLIAKYKGETKREEYRDGRSLHTPGLGERGGWRGRGGKRGGNRGIRRVSRRSRKRVWRLKSLFRYRGGEEEDEGVLDKPHIEGWKRKRVLGLGWKGGRDYKRCKQIQLSKRTKSPCNGGEKKKTNG